MLPVMQKLFKVSDHMILFFFLFNKQLPSTLRSEKGITRIEAVSYRFGGLYSLLIGVAERRLVDAIIDCHVLWATKAHFEKLQVLAAIAVAQDDNQFSDTFRKQT